MNLFKEERKRLNLSQQDVANLCQNSTRTISYWENKKFTASAENLKVLSENGFDVGYILTGIRVKSVSEADHAIYDTELLEALQLLLQTHEQQIKKIRRLINKLQCF